MRRNLDQTVFLAPETMASLAATALVRDLCAEVRGLGGELTTSERARSTLRLTALSALLLGAAWLYWRLPLGGGGRDQGRPHRRCGLWPAADRNPRDGAWHPAGLPDSGAMAGLFAQLADGLALSHLCTPASSPPLLESHSRMPLPPHQQAWDCAPGAT